MIWGFRQRPSDPHTRIRLPSAVEVLFGDEPHPYFVGYIAVLAIGLKRVTKMSVVTSATGHRRGQFDVPQILTPLLIAAPCLIALSFAILAPVGNSVVGHPNGEWFYKALSPICHQFPTRSFWLFEHPMALCARCTGGYFGVALGFLLLIWGRDQFRSELFILSVAGFSLSVLEAYLLISEGNVWRFFSGFVGGISFICFLTICINKLLFRFKEQNVKWRSQ